MSANTQDCKNCEDQISPRFVNGGKEWGGYQEGWLHTTAKRECASGGTVAEPADAEPSESED